MDNIQKRQYMRWWRWQKLENIKDSPATRTETYSESGQQQRINWLVDQCKGTGDILEVGCSRGYILQKVGGRCGLDFNPKIILENCLIKPSIEWICWDATNLPLPFDDATFDIVLLPDILEHVSYRKVKPIIRDCLRVARSKVLITIPNALSPNRNLRNYACFKHKWCLTKERFDKMFKGFNYAVEVSPEFVMVEVKK